MSSIQGRPEPTTHEDRVRATKVMLGLAEDQAVADDLRLQAAQAILYAPAYDIDGDAQDALADRVAARLQG